jgi:hypothetical protein
MRKSILALCLLLLIPACLSRAAAQENSRTPETAQASDAPVHYYQLEFVVQELNSDGKPVNGRTYTGIASTNRKDLTIAIRTGSRIPISTAPSSASSGSQSQIQYVDVGVNIDLRDAVHEVGNQLAFTLVAEVSSLGSNPGPLAPNDPVIRQNRWQAPVLIPVGKPTVVFKSDDLDTKGSMQVTVKATPLQ